MVSLVVKVDDAFYVPDADGDGEWVAALVEFDASAMSEITFSATDASGALLNLSLEDLRQVLKHAEEALATTTPK